jgi:hypothetical protein
MTMTGNAKIERVRRAVEDFRTSFARKRSRSRIAGDQRGRTHPGTTPDVGSVRAKSTGHGKVTADKWNQ